MSERRTAYKRNRKIGMSRENAAISAGFSRSTAMRRTTLRVPVDFYELFEQASLTDKMKVDRCVEGMNATKIFVDKAGETHITPDWTVRHKWFETMLKLCKQMDQGKAGDTNVILIGSLAERIKEARERTTAGVVVKSAHVENDDVVVDADFQAENEEEVNLEMREDDL